MDICNPSENSCFSKIFLYCWNVISLDFNLSLGRFYKMRVSWNLAFTTFLGQHINAVLSFSQRDEYYLWLDSKYNIETLWRFSSE